MPATSRDLVRGMALALLAAACWLAPASVRADSYVYVAGFFNEFGTLDLNTGSFNQLGTLDLPAGDAMYGMGYGPDGQLYGVDAEPDANLWRINPSNGDVTLIGSIGQSALDATSDAAGTLYVLSQDLNALYYTMSPPSTTPNIIGPIGMSSGGLMAVTPDGTSLYTTTQSTYQLVSIDPTSGAATPIGTGLGFGVDNGLFVNGTLYGFDIYSDAIVTINTATGTATQVATYSLPGGDQIVSSAIVPEPSSLVLALVGVLAGPFLVARHRACRASRA